MEWFPRKKQSLDLMGLLTRKAERPWGEKAMVAIGLAFFAYAAHGIFFGA